MKKTFTSGFTLVELMVCVAIMMILSSVIIFNHKEFNDNLEITNLSYQVGLALRQAQVYGVSTRDFKEGVGTSQADRFNTPYGVHFDITPNTGKPAEYIFFADANKNGIYDIPPTDTILETVAIGRGNKISKICKKIITGTTCGLNIADITFTRPEPEPIFSVGSTIDPNISTVAICLTSPGGRYKKITVYNTGQISITNTTSTCS